MHAAKKKVLPDLLERKCDQTKLPFVGQNGHFKVKVEGLYCNDIISFLNWLFKFFRYIAPGLNKLKI